MSVSANPPGAIDGAIQPDTLIRKATQSPHQNDICCIFVHAGAGYHSHANEKTHLEACNDAAAVAMLILRNGGSALDAAEMAVKILEDREITNAGYGSNLAMDGVVECDASIVDHNGRSGAVGAVFNIKNPVSLARMILNHTTQSLTLRRVPPNLLVAQGALDFAREMGMPELPHDALVSPAAKERWLRWKSDLKAAERKARKTGTHPSCWKIRPPSSADDECEQERLRREHTKNLLQGYPMLSRPLSPIPSEDALYYGGGESSPSSSDPSRPQSDVSMGSWSSDEPVTTPESLQPPPYQEPPTVRPLTVEESSRSAFINSTQKVPTISQYRDSPVARNAAMDRIGEDAAIQNADRGANFGRRSWGDGSEEGSDSASSVTTMRPPAVPTNTPLFNTSLNSRVEDSISLATTALNHSPTPSGAGPDKEDHVTDTVGAIAVDGWGNIACAASSGGIGMKYRGRVGPAALIGVGAAVIPIDPDDPERTCVGTVTSGTGEHMATTMAATVCAERLYQSVTKQKGGEYADATEDEALRSMIENEFMGHPSVKNSNSAGAIGILGIKKTRHGLMLYYGHNTDSFAMASMHSREDEPTCAMSRSNGNGQIAQGGRMVRYGRKKKMKTTPLTRQQFPNA
ncbi:N-terminal nucleophile aminohydrolase [Lentithecium fluviatile CBS 122367]|uniref:N-terminal nucleophile aminohydrolase n=1 Tax=Lentithecium fluviatile CBS 122367 TaxID=1168545 RepID=A0A6G1JMH8_9PLEO|nr:N-terminal nucleophile aminohydrolase [Lentithecium fluviatile CBS 122367]